MKNYFKWYHQHTGIHYWNHHLLSSHIMLVRSHFLCIHFCGSICQFCYTKLPGLFSSHTTPFLAFTTLFNVLPLWNHQVVLHRLLLVILHWWMPTWHQIDIVPVTIVQQMPEQVSFFQIELPKKIFLQNQHHTVVQRLFPQNKLCAFFGYHLQKNLF